MCQFKISLFTDVAWILHAPLPTHQRWETAQARVHDLKLNRVILMGLYHFMEMKFLSLCLYPAMTRFSGSYAVMPEIAPVLPHLSRGHDSGVEGTIDDYVDANYSVHEWYYIAIKPIPLQEYLTTLFSHCMISFLLPADVVNHSFQRRPCDEPGWDCFCFQLWVWFSMWMWIGIYSYNKFTVAHLLRSDIFLLSATHHSCVHACKITSVCISVLLLNVPGLFLQGAVQ